MMLNLPAEYIELAKVIAYPFCKRGESVEESDWFQEAVLRMWLVMPKVDPLRDPKPFLAAAAHRRLIDIYRTNRFYNSFSRWGDEDDVEIEPKFEEDFDNKDLVENILKEMPATAYSDRIPTMIKMWYYEGISHQEIADKFGSPKNTTKRQLNSVGHLIRNRLKENPSISKRLIGEAIS